MTSDQDSTRPAFPVDEVAKAEQEAQEQQQAANAEAAPAGAQTEPQGPREFEHRIEGQPDYARVTVQLPADAKIKAEASVMVAMDTNIGMKTRFKGGIKRLVSRESLFINEFTANQMPGEVVFASGMPGDIRHYHLDGVQKKAIFLQSSSFLASGMGVDVNIKFQGLVKGFFSGAGLFLIKCEGQGDVFFNSYGGIIEIDVKGEYIIDNNHIVAFEEGLEYNVQKFGGYKSLFLSKEGLVTRFTGEGKVWIQTRKLPAFAAWIYPFRPKQSSN